MKDFETVQTREAPQAIGPYSQALECRPGRIVFLSGQIGIDPKTGMLAGDEVAEQARQALKNLDAVLLTAGLARWNVVKTTIYLLDMDHYPAVNDVYAEYFGDHRPARAAVQVAGLPKGALVEVEAIAVGD